LFVVSGREHRGCDDGRGRLRSPLTAPQHQVPCDVGRGRGALSDGQAAVGGGRPQTRPRAAADAIAAPHRRPHPGARAPAAQHATRRREDPGSR